VHPGRQGGQERAPDRARGERGRRLRPSRHDPDKTLRETALAFSEFPRKTGRVFELSMREDLEIASLLARMEHVVKAHECFMADQLRATRRSSCTAARLRDAHHVEVETVTGLVKRVRGEFIVIATGSRAAHAGRRPGRPRPHPRQRLDPLDELAAEVAHRARAGVIAAEYATIFAALGVKVTMIDRGSRPLGFLDPEIVDRFVASFQRMAASFLAGRKYASVEWDGLESVVTRLDDARSCAARSCSAASAASPTSTASSSTRRASRRTTAA
jgi:NAD(P) transhydrogenase